MQRVHFQVRVFSTNLGKDFFRYFWYCEKEANWMWFSMTLVKFYWFGINWHVVNQSECRNCCLYIIIQKTAPQAKSGKYFPVADLGEGLARPLPPPPPILGKKRRNEWREKGQQGKKIKLKVWIRHCFLIWFFPRFFFFLWGGGGGMAAFWACAGKLSWTLLSPARVQPLYGAGRKESSGTGLRYMWSFCSMRGEKRKTGDAAACTID